MGLVRKHKEKDSYLIDSSASLLWDQGVYPTNNTETREKVCIELLKPQRSERFLRSTSSKSLY